jgi:hypothetical protein
MKHRRAYIQSAILPAFVTGLILAFLFSSHAASEDLLKSADEVLEAVSEIRGLEPKNPIKKGLSTREEILSYLKQRIEKEFPLEEILAEERLLKRLGLIPEDLVLYDFMLELLTEQVAGYYDPYTKTFYIADWLPLAIQKPVMAHELMHALQDQYFELEKFLEDEGDNDDQTLARNALVEGEGLLIMLEYTLRPFGRSFRDIPDLVELNRSQMPLMEAQFGVFASAPPYLKETLIFPYTYGANFLQFFLRENSWAEVATIYENLPQSTEQILHPEKYAKETDEPTVIDQSSIELPGEDWSTVCENVLGEFTWYLLLNGAIDEETARTASEGWDGDVVLLYESPSGLQLLVISSVWDSEADAREFYDAYSLLINKKYGFSDSVSEDRGPSDQKRIWENSDHHVSIVRVGNSVRVREVEQ